MSEKDFEKKFLPSWESHFYVAVTMFDCFDPSSETNTFLEPLRKEVFAVLPVMYTIFALAGKFFTNWRFFPDSQESNFLQLVK